MPVLAADLRGLLEAIDAVDCSVIGRGCRSVGRSRAVRRHHHADTYGLVLSDATPRDASVEPAFPTPRDATEPSEGDAGFGGWRHAMQPRPDLTALLPTINVPTLVIVGTEDASILRGLPRLIDGLSHRRVVRLHGCTHSTSGQRPAEWTAAVLVFLADLEAGRAIDGDKVH